MELTADDLAIIDSAQEERNPGIFLNYYVRPRSGGYLVYPDSVRHEAYLQRWNEAGRPDTFYAVSSGVRFPIHPVTKDGKPIPAGISDYKLVRDMGNGYGKVNIVHFKEERGFIPLPWITEMHRSPQEEKVVIGVPGTGKTMGVAGEAMYLCATIPNFRFLNVAPVLYQANLMLRTLDEYFADTLFRERFLMPGKSGWVTKPYTLLRFKNGSTFECLNVANNATNIQSWSGDAINGDEFGLLNDLDEDGTEKAANILIGLATRLRGIRPDGHPRMGRLSIISMAYDCDTLWDRYELGLTEEGRKRIWSRLVLHDENPYLSKKDVERMRRNVPPGGEAQWIKGERPQKKGAEFPYALIKPMLSVSQRGYADMHIVQGTPGWISEPFRYEEPPIEGHTYCMAGDPGMGDPPDRNAPVILVFDVTEFPHGKARLAAFWWGYGSGSYTPFINQFKTYANSYHVDMNFRGYDSTSSQKALAELAFASGDDAVIPLGFEGNNKWMYLNALKLLMSKQRIQVPAGLDGLERQLKRYTLPDKKIPQDIVSALAMVAHLIYPLYRAEYPEFDSEDEDTRPFSGAFTSVGRANRATARAGWRF